jgi:hypothetical protein
MHVRSNLPHLQSSGSVRSTEEMRVLKVEAMRVWYMARYLVGKVSSRMHPSGPDSESTASLDKRVSARLSWRVARDSSDLVFAAVRNC